MKTQPLAAVIAAATPFPIIYERGDLLPSAKRNGTDGRYFPHILLGGKKRNRICINAGGGPMEEHEANAALLAHSPAALKRCVEALELDLLFHSRAFTHHSLPDFQAKGYTGTGDGNEMRAWLNKLKDDALAAANNVEVP